MLLYNPHCAAGVSYDFSGLVFSAFFSAVFSASVFRTPRPALMIIMVNAVALNGPISGLILVNPRPQENVVERQRT
jgi:hypothetical protein